MRANHPPPQGYQQPALLDGFDWPGNPRSYSMLRDRQMLVTEADAGVVLDILRTHPGRYVSFQDHHTLELNANYSNQITPGAIYAFPRDYLAHMLWRLTLGQTTVATTGVGFLPRANLLTFDIEGRIADSDTYLNTDLVGDMECIMQTWQPGSPAILGLAYTVDAQGVKGTITRWLDQMHRHCNDAPDQQLKYLVWISESVVNSMLPTQDNDGYREHRDKPALWRSVLASLGYSAILDQHGVLTGDIEQQIAVLDQGAIRNQVCIANPLATLGADPDAPGIRHPMA